MFPVQGKMWRNRALRLRSLELTNYRRFKAAAIEFQDGVIGILGMNGSGKSTIIEAIAWALYGNQPTIVRTQKEHLKRFGAGVSDPCEVKLEFDLDGDKYLVTRKMTGKNYSTTAEVTVNGSSVATSTSAVTDLIEAKLGMDYQAFYTSIFAKQKELNALSILDPNKRKKLILRMLKIDSIDKAMISVRRDARDYSTRLKELRTTLRAEDGTPRIELEKKNVKELTEKIQEVKRSITNLEKQISKIAAHLKDIENIRSKQRRLKDDYNKLNNKLTEADSKLESMTQQQTKLEAELETLKKQQTELKSLEPKRSEWTKVKTRKEELDEQYGKFVRASELGEQLKQTEGHTIKYDEKLKELKDELKKFHDLDEQIRSCEQSKENVILELDGLNKNLSEDRSMSVLIDTEMNKLQVKLAEISNLGPESECPTCDRVLGQHYTVLENKFQHELAELVEKKKSMDKDILSYEKLFDDARKRKDALIKKGKYLGSLEKEFTRVEQNIKNCEAELELYKEKKNALVTDLAKLGRFEFKMDEYNKLKGRYKELEKVYERIIGLSNNVEKLPKIDKELAELVEVHRSLLENKITIEGQISKLGFDQNVLNEVEESFEAQTRSLKEHELDLKENENEVKVHNKEIEKLNERIADLEDRERRVLGYEDELTYLNKLDSVLNKFRSYMISRIAPTLTQYTSDLFRDLTDGKYNRVEVDNDYNVTIFDQGEEFPLSRFSGGEEDLANLCLRLAISQVITTQANASGPRFVILDEVFGSQDVHRKRNLMSALNVLSNKFRQILLITHIEDIKEYMEYYFQVSEEDDQTSSIKVVGN